MDIEQDKYQEIPSNLLHPEYTSSFSNGTTVFLEPGYTLQKKFLSEYVEGAVYFHNGGLASIYPREVREEALQKAEEEGHQKNSPAFLEAYLCYLLNDQELQLVHIVAGVVQSIGYTYQIYGCIKGKKDSSVEEA